MRKPESAHQSDTGSVADRVTDLLRTAILANQLKSGEEFSLRRVANELGVSFIPVREALRSLEAEGLVYTRRGRSATVTPLSHEELDGTFGLRQQIEPNLASVAAPLHGVEPLNQLAGVLSVCQDPSTDPDQHAHAHIAFQLGLLRPATTSMAMRTVQTLVRATSRYERIVAESIGTPPEQHLAEHYPPTRLLEAFRTGDPDTACKATQRRLETLEAICRQAVPRSP